MKRLAPLAVVIFGATTDAADAHVVIGVTGFAGGLLHPLLVPAHVMATAALALLIGQRQGLRTLPIAYAAGVMLGLGAIALAYVPPFAEEALLVLCAITGLLVAFAQPLPWLFDVVLAAATGLALALDSPPEAVSISEANLTLLGTGLSATALLTVLAWFASQIRYDGQRIGARILGSWIAASAIIVLALRMVGS